MGFWRSFIKEWFTFSRSERQGIWVLLFIVVCAVVVAKMYPEPTVTLADPTLIAEANRINNLIKEDSTYSYSEPTPPTHESKSVALSLSLFNPNSVTQEQLQSMGLPETAIKSLIGYRSSGGVFRKPEDIQRLYGLSPELSAKLIPYLTIPDSLKKKDYGFKKRDSLLYQARFPIEINGADTTSLILLKGIGSTLSKKIIAYRNRLGGFYSSDQLLEIYGLHGETILQMKDQFTIDTTKLVKWSINILPPDSMAKHPYLSRYQANAIGFYRKKVGKIRSVDELVRNRILPANVGQKLRPYIKF